MQIKAHSLGKRYNRHWIFRNLTAHFLANEPVAITGPNGSGKSTLLQVIGGALEKSEGSLEYTIADTQILPENQFRYVAICAPYLEVIEELTLIEFLEFHQRFKPWLDGLKTTDIIQLMGLENAANKQIRDFSSGMKQRVKLAQAILTKSPVLLLDEPTSNLDTNGITMYHEWMEKFVQNKVVVIASNDESEISICHHRIHITDFSQ